MQQNRFHTRFADTIFEGDENCCIFSHSVYRRLFLYEKQNFKKKKIDIKMLNYHHVLHVKLFVGMLTDIQTVGAYFVKRVV